MLYGELSDRKGGHADFPEVNVDAIAADARLFRDMGVKRLFMECEYRDQPFHAEVAGCDKGGLPTAPWIKGKKFRELSGEKRKGGKFHRRHAHGRRQPDFGQKAKFS